MRIERFVLAFLLVVAASSCRDEAAPPPVPGGRLLRAKGEPGRSLIGLIPSEAPAGTIFQKQPDGHAGLAILGTGFERGDAVHWSGRALETMYSNSRFLTASVPPELLGAAGDVDVTIESPSDRSRPPLRATFHLRAPAPASR